MTQQANGMFAASTSPIPREAVEQVARYIESWKRSLIDFSRRNRLIDFHRGFATRVRISNPGLQALYQALALDERRLAFPYVRGVSIDDLDLEEVAERARVAPGDLDVEPSPATPRDVRDLQRKLERLRRNTRTVYEEQGVHTLFLALGMLEWKEAEGDARNLVSPLLLVPVQLDRVTDRYFLRPHDDPPEVNPTLDYRLQRDFGLTLPSLDTNGETEETVAIVDQFLQEVRDVVQSRGWAVLEEAWLAQFAFYKLPMYRDLEAPGTAELAASHPVVAALCGLRDRSEPISVDLRKVEEEGARPETFPVADADSSQLEVIEQVRQGRTIVVQGPPGTGKSQTIVNIIAQALRDGRKVLFVSEKRAALEVVYSRLQKLGLAELCLDLHSNRANRRAVVEELEATLETLTSWHKQADRNAFEEYRRLRARLNQYVEELHKPRDRQGRSAFDVQAALARLHDVPYVVAQLPFERIHEVEREHEDAVLALIDRLAKLGVWDEAETHPWREAKPSADFVPIAESVRATYGVLRKVTQDLLGVAGELGELIGDSVETAGQLQARLSLLQWLAKIPDVTIRPEWLTLDPAGRRALVQLAHDAEEHARRRREGLAYLRGMGVHPGWDAGGGRPEDAEVQEVRALLGLLQEAAKRRWIGRIGTEWRVQRRVKRLTGRKLRRAEAIGVVRALFTVHESHAWIEANAERIRNELGIEPGTDDWDPAATVRGVEWVVAAIEAAGGALGEHLRQQLVRDARIIRQRATSLLDRASNLLQAWGRAVASETVVQCFSDGLGGVKFADIPLEQLRDKCATWEQQAGRLPEWLEHSRLMRKADEAGLSAFLEACRAQRVTATQLVDAFRRAYLVQWLAAAHRESEVLRHFSSQAYEEVRRAFRELDERLQEQAIIATFESVAARMPVPLPASERTVLAREATKSRRHLPLRKLFPLIPRLLLAVKPCLMMSPLTVATYLPRGLFQFDLVIFDEASQLPPGDAIGALLRAQQAVIFGDSKQLPPTDFFRAHAEGEEEEEDAQDYESILDIASVYFPGPMLRWHYRSRDERLIAFSNRNFYGGQLVTFPAPGMGTDETGVSFVYVADGAFGRGGSRVNRVEAERVAELVLDHCRTAPHLSLGVITMSIEQRDAVEEAIRRLLRAHPEVELPNREEFFVKNLETVQGDERDVIILSIGYGPSEPGGTPSLNFGPLNRLGGDRRLNVAITRARYRMIVVSSMMPEQLASVVGQARWDGPKLLAGYLRYAEKGGADAEISGTGEPESEFEEAVRDALVARGYEVDCQVGVSAYRIDLAVRDPDCPGRYLVGIECDGATYHSARTARDRDRIRQMALENLGWRILRVWSTEWIRDPAAATARLVEAIERVREERRQRETFVAVSEVDEGPPEQECSAERVERPQSDEQAQGTSDGVQQVTSLLALSQPAVDAVSTSDGRRQAAGLVVDLGPALPPYQAYQEREGFVRAHAITDELLGVLTELVHQIVEVEAPLHVEQLCQRLRDLYGHRKLGGRMRDFILQAVSRAVARGWVTQRGDFLWRRGQNASDVPPRGPGEVTRPPEHICPEEWEAAALEVLRQLGAIDRENAVRAIARAVLGTKRLSYREREHAERAIDELVAKGRLFVHQGYLHVH